MIRFISKGILRVLLYIVLIVDFILSTFSSDLTRNGTFCEYLYSYKNLFTLGNIITILLYLLVVVLAGELIKKKLDKDDNEPLNENGYSSSNFADGGDAYDAVRRALENRTNN